MPLACSNVSVIGTALTLLLLNGTYHNFTLYLLGVNSGPPCLHLKSFLETLSKQYDFKLIWIPVDQNKTKLLSLATEILTSAGVIPGVPITLVYCNKTLVAVVEGAVLDANFWLKDVMKCTNVTRVYYGNKLVATLNVTSLGTVPIDVIPLITAMIVDSLNPVGLTILGLLMILCVNKKGKCYKELIVFTIAYVSAHLLLGRLLGTLGASKLYSLIGMAAALFMIAASLKPTNSLRKAASFMSDKLSKLVLKGGSVFLVGAASSTVAMSPCVVGAYLSATSLISKMPPYLELYLWALYAVIYSLPVILLGFFIHKGKSFIEPRKMILILATISFVLSLYTYLAK